MFCVRCALFCFSLLEGRKKRMARVSVVYVHIYAVVVTVGNGVFCIHMRLGLATSKIETKNKNNKEWRTKQNKTRVCIL